MNQTEEDVKRQIQNHLICKLSEILPSCSRTYIQQVVDYTYNFIAKKNSNPGTNNMDVSLFDIESCKYFLTDSERETLEKYLFRRLIRQIPEEDIKQQILHYIQTSYKGILPICTEERIQKIVDDTFCGIMNNEYVSRYFSGKELNGCARDEIMRYLTEEENNNICYGQVMHFLAPHEQTYDQALREIRNGKKETHWMWWIFPQMIGLGESEHSQFYGICNRDEARIFLKHPILGKHLREITQAVLESNKTPYEIFGNDVIKFRSCMLLFDSIEQEPSQNVFKKVLVKNYWN